MAIQASRVVVMVLKETDAGPRPGTRTVSLREAHRRRHGRSALKQPSFNWNATGKYIELLSFEMEVTNILQTKTYELNEEEKLPYHKIC